ncbi:GNAT family N-acetyltransferase [Natronobeatus ordinarius]|uniref:GNAT family N-acetyltransferase n=1 Tax=Natronobeatus ordinarius TaxID=2963433 RepID=UPI0020CE215F|nr:GNAT family N-acetyltransferase [Natronobeatus ordinarius]
MEIREAVTADREAIREVARATWHDTYDELEAVTIDETVDEWYADDELETAIGGWYADADFDLDLENLKSTLLVAEVDGEVVGFTHGVVMGEEGDVLRMYVHPDHQGAGIGTALHERLVAALEAAGVERIRALDLASNEASRRFYEGLGFERTAEATVEIGGERYAEAVYTIEL